MTSNLSIAHVISTPYGIGGAERVLLALVRHGKHAGWQQRVINPFAAADHTELSEAVGEGFVPVPGTTLKDIARVRDQTMGALIEFDPDIIHVHLFHASALVASIGRDALKCPRVLSHQHGRLLWERRRWLEGCVDWWAGSRYDKVVGCSANVSDFLSRRYRYANQRVEVIWNGWQGSPQPLKAPEPGVFRLICIANFRPEKNLLMLLEVFASLAREGHDMSLTLVGDGPMRRRIYDSISSLGVDSQIELTGAVDDVWPHLAESHALVLPSDHEPLGIVLLEAMAAGLPSVATRVGGIPEVVTDGVTGILVPSSDPDALKDAIFDLYSNPGFRKKLGSNAKERAPAWHIDRTVQRYSDLYLDLLSSASTG